VRTRSGRWSAEGLYLSLETSGTVGSVALARGPEVLARAFLLRAGEQSAKVLPAIEAVLRAAGLSRAALSGVVVGAGPGSFTGVRIAAATAKGIVHALELPLWAFSSLMAGALSDRVLPRGAGPEGWGVNGADDAGRVRAPLRWVLFDARGERVYAACYRIDPEGTTRVEAVVPGRATTVGELLSGALEPGTAFAGDGAVRHRERIEAAGYAVLGPPAGTPTADALLHLLARHPEQPPLANPGGWEPEYLKASSAERGAF
jgi:tRNA threonylcarbamoyl adenosine modification protein YeaZ